MRLPASVVSLGSRSTTVRRARIALAALLAVGMLTACGSSEAKPAKKTCSVDAAAGRTTAPPWDAPTDALARIRTACLPPLSAEGTVLHIHMLLVVYVDGTRQVLPAGIGIDEQAERISPIHTHDTSGIIHVESPKKRSFTLGQLFVEWNVKLAGRALGGTSARSTLRWWVNGRQRTGDPASLTFAPHQIIVLVYGPPEQQVQVPRTYNWGDL